VVAHAAVIALVPLAIVPAAVGVGIGLAVARAHRTTAARAQLALEQVLDRLEHGEARRATTVLDVMSSVARRIK
jgi:predicted membrane-bound mannosyltransferase